MKKDSVNQKIQTAITFEKTGNKDLMRLILGIVTAENSGQLPETADIGHYQSALWVGEGSNLVGLSAKDFAASYKKVYQFLMLIITIWC